MDNKKYFLLGYLSCAGFGFVLLVATISIIISRKRKIEIYNVLS